MDNKTFQELTKTTAIYPNKQAIEYLVLGLASEAGEVASKLKKAIRDNYPEEIFKVKIKSELGDCLWYISQLCNELDFTIDELMDQNIQKLTQRRVNNTLKGDGDDR